MHQPTKDALAMAERIKDDETFGIEIAMRVHPDEWRGTIIELARLLRESARQASEEAAQVGIFQRALSELLQDADDELRTKVARIVLRETFEEIGVAG